MSKENVELIRGLYAAFAAGDAPGVLGVMSPNITWVEAENFPYADGNPYVGPEAVAKGVFARCASEWDAFAADAEEYLDAGESVVVLGRYRGTYKATKLVLNAQFVHVWRVEGGKAAGFRQFVDTLQTARIIGAVK